jgi:serine phosphatase RsbU (regulator of sigma subunit)
MSTEWDLLVIAEDIEPGDTLIYEKDGIEHKTVFCKIEAGIIYTKEGRGAVRKFRASSLEEVKGSAFLVRKSDEALLLK